MVMSGEVVGMIGRFDQTQCTECRDVLTLQVCRSPAGYYLGYICPNCGPYSRETGYFQSWDEANEALNSKDRAAFAR